MTSRQIRKREKAFVRFLKQYKPNLYWLAYSYMKNEQDSLDVIQDSIQKALQSLERLEDEERMKAWFYQILTRTAIDAIRKRQHSISYDSDRLIELVATKVDTYPDADLRQALEELPVMYREVVILHYFEDLILKDVATILELNLSTTKSRLYKGLTLLKMKLNGDDLDVKQT